MKVKLSVAVDEDTIALVENLIKSGKFRNRSHAFEYAMRSYCDGDGVGRR